MQLSSVYLYEKIKEKYEITERGTLSGSDGYLRPFLCYEKKETFRHGHVYVVQRYDKEWESAVLTAENILWVFCGREKIDAASEELQQIPYIHIALDSLKEIAEFMNDVQEIFDAADEWERKIHDLMLEHAGMDRLLQVTSEFLQNPMTVTGLDFTFVAEAGSEYLGIAGGDGCGVLIKHGEVVRKVPEDELLSTLKYELDHWGGTGV